MGARSIIEEEKIPVETIFIVGKDKMRANTTRDFHEGDPFQWNGVPHKVAAVHHETTRRLVHLVEAPIESNISHTHVHRRSRKATQGDAE